MTIVHGLPLRSLGEIVSPPPPPTSSFVKTIPSLGHLGTMDPFISMLVFNCTYLFVCLSPLLDSSTQLLRAGAVSCALFVLSKSSRVRNA